MLTIKWIRWAEFSVLSHHVNINYSSRTILVQTLLSKDRFNHFTVVNLLRKGLPLRGHDFKDITSGHDLTTLDFTPQLVAELNAQSPNLLERTIPSSGRKNTFKFIEKLVKLGLEVTVGCLKNAFNSGSLLAIDVLIKYAQETVKWQLKESVPNAHQLLFNAYSSIFSDVTDSHKSDSIKQFAVAWMPACPHIEGNDRHDGSGHYT